MKPSQQDSASANLAAGHSANGKDSKHNCEPQKIPVKAKTKKELEEEANRHREEEEARAAEALQEIERLKQEEIDAFKN